MAAGVPNSNSASTSVNTHVFTSLLPPQTLTPSPPSLFYTLYQPSLSLSSYLTDVEPLGIVCCSTTSTGHTFDISQITVEEILDEAITPTSTELTMKFSGSPTTSGTSTTSQTKYGFVVECTIDTLPKPSSKSENMEEFHNSPQPSSTSAHQLRRFSSKVVSEALLPNKGEVPQLSSRKVLVHQPQHPIPPLVPLPLNFKSRVKTHHAEACRKVTPSCASSRDGSFPTPLTPTPATPPSDLIGDI